MARSVKTLRETVNKATKLLTLHRTPPNIQTLQISSAEWNLIINWFQVCWTLSLQEMKQRGVALSPEKRSNNTEISWLLHSLLQMFQRCTKPSIKWMQFKIIFMVDGSDTTISISRAIWSIFDMKERSPVSHVGEGEDAEDCHQNVGNCEIEQEIVCDAPHGPVSWKC